jgi:ABC-2 type transport system permease protein
MLRFWRSKSRIIGALSTPLTFMMFLAPGLSSGFQFRGGGNVDISFFAPGFIGMSVLFASLFGGGAIIWERESGIIKEVLVAPVSRFFIALGKAVGGVTIAIIQGLTILIFAKLIGVNFVSIAGVIASIAVMFLLGLGFNALGIALASKIESQEGFQMIMSFLTMPLVLLSGAFFPISDLPVWLKWLVYLNPLTYGVEALRWCLLGSCTIPFSLCIAVVTLFALVMLGIGGRLFGNLRA